MTKTESRVSISIVAWNSRQHLPSCLLALQEQTFTNFQVMIVDNSSADGTVAWLEEYYPHYNLLRNTRNMGFCRAHNQSIRITKSEYVLVLNPDVVLSPAWLERAVAWMDQHPKVGSYGGKLRRYTYSPDELKEVQISDIIDSAGLRGSRSRHFVDRGAGQHDTGQYDQAEEVFGLSGGCVLFRRSALDSVRYKSEYFDEHFFAYKDDVDLAWRLQRQGWSSWYDPKTIAWHHREIKGLDEKKNVLIAKNYRARQGMIAFYSYRNHLLMLAKNESASSALRDLPWIGWFELRKVVFLLFTRPRTLRGLGQVLRWWSHMKKKSQMIDRPERQTAQQIRDRWMH